jgi:hypothetical protein
MVSVDRAQCRWNLPTIQEASCIYPSATHDMRRIITCKRTHARARTHKHTCRHAHAHAQPAHTHHPLRGPKRVLPKRRGACPAELTPHPHAAAPRAWDRSQPASQRDRAHLTGWTGMHHSGTELWRILARRRASRLATPCASHVVRRVLCAACRRVAPAAAECVAVRDQPVPCFLRDDQIEGGRPRQDVAVAAADQTGDAAACLSGADWRISRADCSTFRGTRPHDVGRSRRRCG